MASKRALQDILGQKSGGLFSKSAPNFYKWGLIPPPALKNCAKLLVLELRQISINSDTLLTM